ncbi:nucleic acid-binding protein [Backusella circina FSU 941]|nr:nucleic acid-binding protein [Backusella circina FSU 941]KAI8889692.1 nucleic acid-binding protein [Backusella circina FSU 941]
MLAALTKRNILCFTKRPLVRFQHSLITEDDLIHRVDLRVGKITQIEQHQDASHLFVEQVDLNTESTEKMPNPRTIVSGLAPFMTKESLLNKDVIVVSNLKPSKFRGVLSQGMLLAAGINDAVQVLSPSNGGITGERIQLEGIEYIGNTDPVLKPKQKVFEQVVSHLKTDENGFATYKGIKLVTSAGNYVSCELKNAPIS